MKPKGVTPMTFGDGWMTKNAQDLCRIMFIFGNLDVQAFVRELGRYQHPNVRLINTRTVENAIARLRQR